MNDIKDKKFSFLDWAIHFGVAINLVVAVLLIWYALTL